VIESNPNISTASSEKSAVEKEAPLTSPRKPGILVVDDDDSVRMFLDVGLRQHGFAVWQAAGGQEAIQVYEQDRSAIDVVLLDIRMPGLDGPQTLIALRGLNPQLRCCFMTGQAGNYRQDELLALGAMRVFAKPFQLTEVAHTLGKLTGHFISRQ
jgi:CheY-like chemotaxis protein